MVGREEEKFIREGWGPTQVEAELVLFQKQGEGWPGGVAEDVLAVEVFIAEEFPRRCHAKSVGAPALGMTSNIRRRRSRPVAAE